MKEYYKILGVNENASDEEIDSAYRTLKDRYSRERFYEGEIGNEAAKNLTKLETAYSEILKNRKEKLDRRANSLLFFRYRRVDKKRRRE